ncbi:hypothetical protein AMTRI_Chr08g167760 [Amborella trichopoda]
MFILAKSCARCWQDKLSLPTVQASNEAIANRAYTINMPSRNPWTRANTLSLETVWTKNRTSWPFQSSTEKAVIYAFGTSILTCLHWLYIRMFCFPSFFKHWKAAFSLLRPLAYPMHVMYRSSK